jgi:hypothetical protein
LTSTTCKPRTPKTRTVKLTSTAPGRGLLTITEGGKPTTFYLHEVATELGGRAFKLEKFGADVRDEWDAVYFVHIGGDLDTCCCRGHQRWGHKTVCRHRAALRALLEAGKLS